MQDSLTHTTNDSSQVFSVDPEHAGLRIAIVGVFFVAAALIYLTTSVLVPVVGVNLIGVVAAVVGASLLTQMVDRLFKQRWPSGRQLKIDGDQIQLRLRDQVQRTIAGDQHVNVLLWCFEVTKRTRIPKGWLMVAIALMQEDTYLPVYTFVAPEAFDQLAYHNQYVKLTGRKQPEAQDMRLAGQQRRLHIAEDARWQDGAEMSKADFERYIASLRQQFPAWMPTE
ncbi:MAG: hypothetical protein H7X77_01045 [Anaerolineae bacterium]|nr:hypothetical protein [Anaerolineae bacterium]